MRASPISPRIAALCAGVALLTGARAHADEIETLQRKIGDIEQRVRSLGDEYKEAPPASIDLADRRVVDAQGLMELRSYAEAATILFDVVEKWPTTRAGREATFLLGETLFQLRDLRSARRYFEMGVETMTGERHEQEALQRLVEIALRTGDYEHVADHLAKLDRIPPQQIEPSVPYVRAKYLYFTGKHDDAVPLFNAIPPSSPFFFQARYFLATVLVVKGDLANATVGYDAIIKQQAPDDAAREIQDMARLALGRILYDRAQFDRAVDAYQAVQRQSKYSTDALYEVGWTYVKAKDWRRAYRAFDLMLLADPDSTQAPELRLLMGNLHLRMGNYYLASDAFNKTRDEFEPVHKLLKDKAAASQGDPSFFTTLVARNLDKFDLTVFIPPSAAKWVRADPDVTQMLALAGDVVGLERDIKDATSLVGRLDKAVASTGKVGLFADLAKARGRSIELLGDIVKVRQKGMLRMRALLQPSLSAEEGRELDRLAAERDVLQRELEVLPLDEDKRAEAGLKVKGEFAVVDGEASKVNVIIQGLEAELVAVDAYYRASEGEQKIKRKDVDTPVRELRAAVDELHAALDKIRDEIADAARAAAVTGAAGEREQVAASRLDAIVGREREIQARVAQRTGAGQRQEMARLSELMTRVQGAHVALGAFDRNLEHQADTRLVTIREALAREKEELEAARGKLGGVVSESQVVGGGLAQAMFSKIADRFYDLVVRSDVGVIDVAWGLKDQKTSALTRLVSQQKAELKVLEDEFRAVIEELKR